MRIDKISKDRRTTAENPAFVAYVTLHVAEDMRRDGMGLLAMMMERAGAAMALEYGRMPSGVFVPEVDFRAVYEGVVETFKREAATHAASLSAGGMKH